MDHPELTGSVVMDFLLSARFKLAENYAYNGPPLANANYSDRARLQAIHKQATVGSVAQCGARCPPADKSRAYFEWYIVCW